MENTKEAAFPKIGWIGWVIRSVSLLTAVLLAAATVQAGQLQSQLVAAELQSRGDLPGAEKQLQSALSEARVAAGTRSMTYARALAILGVFYHDLGRFSQAESSFTESLRIAREIKGDEDPGLAPVIIQLAWLYIETGRPGPASRLQPQSWIDRLTLSDPESGYLPMLLETLGGLNALQGKVAAATNIYRRDFELLAKRGASVSVEMASARNNFGFIQLRTGRYREARNEFSKALQLWTELPGDGLQVAISQLGLAETNMALGRYDEAGKFFREVLPVFEQKCGPNSLRTEDVLVHYAQVLRHQKRKEEARRLEERARLIRKASTRDLAFQQVIDVRDLKKTDASLEDSSSPDAKQRSVVVHERKGAFVPN
jgi:tetratricopeptide (TPR) repeat protein